MPPGDVPPRGRSVLAPDLLDRVAAAVLVVDLDGVVTYANPFCEILYGRKPADMLGRQSGDFVQEPVSVELRREIMAALEERRSWEGDFSVVRSDGSLIDVHAINSPVFDEAGAISGVVTLAFDVTDERRTQEQQRQLFALGQILQDVGKTLMSELDADRVMQTVTDAARRLTRAAIGAFLVLNDDAEEHRFVIGAVSGHTTESTVGDPVPTTAPLVGVALKGAVARRFDDVTSDPLYSGTLDVIMRSPRAPLRSSLVALVRARSGDIVGAMVLAHPDVKRFTEDDERLLVAIASQAGVVLDIARLFRAAEFEIAARRRAEAVQRFHAETSTMLSWALDFPESYERFASLCVPFLADLCLIDVAEEHTIRRVAAVHADPAKAALVAELEKHYAPDPFGMHPAASVVRGGGSELAEDVSDEMLRATTRSEEHFRIVKTLGFTSYMCVPLTARGRILGALTLVSAGSGRRFGPEDVALAEECARRAGLAIDNARLFFERDHVARALQSSLLPPSLPEIPGVSIAGRYRAAGEGNEVGGDFYDVFQVRRNEWWFVIGDVSGKGPEAAAIAGLARHTLRAVALQERTPRRLLTALHHTLAHGEGNGEFCTVCCALLELNPEGARLLLASAGHPPPLIRRASGAVEVATCSGPLLGMTLRQLAFEQQLVMLDPGDSVLLYTDGITEAHHRNQELFGEERLIEVVQNAEPNVDAIADGVLAAVTEYGPADPRDDLAAIVVQIDAH
jgi:PAS domain S-box-containing protein